MTSFGALSSSLLSMFAKSLEFLSGHAFLPVKLISSEYKRKQKLSTACLLSYLQILSTITMTYTISMDPSQLH